MRDISSVSKCGGEHPIFLSMIYDAVFLMVRNDHPVAKLPGIKCGLLKNHQKIQMYLLDSPRDTSFSRDSPATRVTHKHHINMRKSTNSARHIQQLPPGKSTGFSHTSGTLSSFARFRWVTACGCRLGVLTPWASTPVEMVQITNIAKLAIWCGCFHNQPDITWNSNW